MAAGESEDWKRRLKALGIVRKPKPRTARRDARKVESGRAGEDAAAAYLEAHGAAVLARNVRYRNGEIDLVVDDAGTTAFVEVKRRKNDARGTPAEAVTSKKRGRVIRAARRWLVENPERARTREVRFDVIAIQDDSPAVEWLRGAFDASR